MTGHRTTLKAEKINYKVLRKINPEAARLAVIEYLKTNKGNISEAARVFGIQRTVVYDILKKKGEGNLKDRSRAPLHSPYKTPGETEDQVIKAKNQTHLGAKRLSIYLQKYEKIKVPYGTIRHILRRNKSKISYQLKGRKKSEKREFVDWYSAKPFQVVQVDLKFIRDHKALTAEQIIHLDYYGIPNYQWGAIDVNSRFKLIAYSREKTWTNGLMFYLWVISWLRSHGVKEEIIFTVDHGEEWGGKCWMKIRELKKLISGFGCKLIQNHKGHPEENAHLERSHRTDDEEFYIPRALKMKSEKDLLDEALGYIYYYNNVREHSSLNYQTPYQYLKKQLPDVDSNIRFVIPIMLDKVSVEIGSWSGYNVLAQYRIKEAHKIADSVKDKAKYIILADFTYPVPQNLAGQAGMIIERIAGGDHYLNFKEYQRLGGLDYFLKYHKLIITDEQIGVAGTIRVIKASGNKLFRA